MQYFELKEQLKNFAVFTLSDIRKIEAKFYRARLNDWQTKGHIKKLRRGYYMFADLALSEKTMFLIANRLYAPSYVSFTGKSNRNFYSAINSKNRTGRITRWPK